VALASILSGITDALTSLIGDHGLYAVFLLMLVDAVLPAASEVVMVYGGAVAAGAFAGQDVVLFGRELDSGLPAYVGIALAGTVGYVLGSIVGWAIGRYGGRPFVERRGRLLHLGPDRLERADRLFERYGDATVLVGRVLPVVRSFVAVPAGVARMPLGRYTLLTIPGSAAWCFALAGVGWGLGANWERFHDAFKYADYAVAAVIAVGAAILLLRMRSSRASPGDVSRFWRAKSKPGKDAGTPTR
jgi:membrane protein DedA with SNARE-associated domain